ncbi:hypothetical protein [Roseitranquillus sediminis]|uniref:hypothetical protein n=1 Tax=Roseitranquillus sediminis TaxID=2809051 RepID=UPI001D0C08DA|nr:hypothetical protein [Roseitranquillus sediminis]MBM9593473.1 hypothetical protein [Roseitranquillus sediminis]
MLWALRALVRAVRLLFRGGILLVIVAMLALNVATLAFAPLAAAAGGLLARAGITTMADAAQSDLAASRRTVAAQADELAAADRRIASQADELATANRRIAAQAAEADALRHVRYRGQVRTVREAVSDTADRIARRTATATARNVAAIPAEAVPLFGIAVIAGATAWELKDACDLMADIHALNVAFDPSLANDPERHEACGRQVPTRAEIWSMVAGDPGGSLNRQPDEYGAPAFETPGWWDWAVSWFGEDLAARE